MDQNQQRLQQRLQQRIKPNSKELRGRTDIQAGGGYLQSGSGTQENNPVGRNMKTGKRKKKSKGSFARGSQQGSAGAAAKGRSPTAGPQQRHEFQEDTVILSDGVPLMREVYQDMRYEPLDRSLPRLMADSPQDGIDTWIGEPLQDNYSFKETFDNQEGNKAYDNGSRGESPRDNLFSGVDIRHERDFTIDDDCRLGYNFEDNVGTHDRKRRHSELHVSSSSEQGRCLDGSSQFDGARINLIPKKKKRARYGSNRQTEQVQMSLSEKAEDYNLIPELMGVCDSTPDGRNITTGYNRRGSLIGDRGRELYDAMPIDYWKARYPDEVMNSLPGPAPRRSIDRLARPPWHLPNLGKGRFHRQNLTVSSAKRSRKKTVGLPRFLNQSYPNRRDSMLPPRRKRNTSSTQSNVIIKQMSDETLASILAKMLVTRKIKMKDRKFRSLSQTDENKPSKVSSSKTGGEKPPGEPSVDSNPALTTEAGKDKKEEIVPCETDEGEGRKASESQTKIGGIFRQIVELEEHGLQGLLHNKVVKQWVCYICDVSVTDMLRYKHHMSSGNHQRKVRELHKTALNNEKHTIALRLKNLPNRNKYSPISLLQSEQAYFCCVCAGSYTCLEGEHVECPDHLRNATRSNYCEDCFLFFVSKKTLDKHQHGCLHETIKQLTNEQKKVTSQERKKLKLKRKQEAMAKSPVASTSNEPAAVVTSDLKASISNSGETDSRPFGIDLIVPVTGFFCRSCSKFFNKKQVAVANHCETPVHHRKALMWYKSRGISINVKETVEIPKTVNGAKEGAKEVAKEGAKEVEKEGAKEVAKEGAKEVAKEGAVEGAKEGAVEGAKEGAKEGAGEGAGEGAVEGAVEESKEATEAVTFSGIKDLEIKLHDEPEDTVQTAEMAESEKPQTPVEVHSIDAGLIGNQDNESLNHQDNEQIAPSQEECQRDELQGDSFPGDVPSGDQEQQLETVDEIGEVRDIKEVENTENIEDSGDVEDTKDIVDIEDDQETAWRVLSGELGEESELNISECSGTGSELEIDGMDVCLE